MRCADCTYWGKEERGDDYQVCYRLWDEALFVTERTPFEKNIPAHRLATVPLLTKPEFGCTQFKERVNGVPV